jgi:hypothetical protein
LSGKPIASLALWFVSSAAQAAGFGSVLNAQRHSEVALMLEVVLLALIVAVLMGIYVIADFSPSRLYSSELRLKYPGYRQAVRRQ